MFVTYKTDYYFNRSEVPKAGDEFSQTSAPPPAYNPTYDEQAYVPTGEVNIESSGFDEVNRRPFLMKVCITGIDPFMFLYF